MEFAFFLAALTAILIGMTGVALGTRMRALSAAERARAARFVDVSRYAPMQRLLSANDLKLVSADPALEKTLRNSRYRIFRGYLRCLTKDFGALLGGVRQMMVNSEVDRPELAMLLVRSKWSFAASLCRIEATLLLYCYGVKTVDVSVVVAQLQNMVQQTQMPVLQASAA